MPGVTIYIPELKTGTISNADGTYLIENLPQIKVLIQLTFIGYKMIASAGGNLDFTPFISNR